MELPLFPLHTVLFPGVALPLHIFEPRYREMVARCLETDSPFGIVLIRDGREIGGGPTSIATIGTTAEIREAGTFSDGRYELLVVGTHRFRIESVTVGREAYLVGDVEELDDEVGDAEAARGLTDRVTQRFVRYLSLLQPVEGEDAEDIDVRVELELEDDPDLLIGSSDRPRSVEPDDPTIDDLPRSTTGTSSTTSPGGWPSRTTRRSCPTSCPGSSRSINPSARSCSRRRRPRRACASSSG